MTSIILKNASLSFANQQYSSFRKEIITNLFFKRKAKENEIKILKGINLEINKGDSLGIIGKNGSGKTTLIRLLAGIYAPTEGYINVEGKVTGLLSFGCGLNKDLSGLENINLSYRYLNEGFSPNKKTINWIKDFSGIRNAIYQPVFTYSSGMQARLAFSIAVANKPDILILDEVMSTGDKDFQMKSQARIENLIKQAGIVIFATHDIISLKKLCKKYILLNNGKIEKYGLTSEL